MFMLFESPLYLGFTIKTLHKYKKRGKNLPLWYLPTYIGLLIINLAFSTVFKNMTEMLTNVGSFMYT